MSPRHRQDGYRSVRADPGYGEGGKMMFVFEHGVYADKVHE